MKLEIEYNGTLNPPIVKIDGEEVERLVEVEFKSGIGIQSFLIKRIKDDLITYEFVGEESFF